MRAYTKRESEIKLIPEEKGGTAGYNILNMKALSDESAAINLAGITWVNKLGVYGNFEKDSDGNGLADEWGINNISSVSLSDNIQMFTPSAQYGGISSLKRTDVFNQHRYLAKIKVKTTDPLVKLYVRRNGGVPSQLSSSFHSGSGEFETMIATIYTDITAVEVYLFVRSESTSGFTPIEVKEAELFDLTEMGPMQKSLANYINSKYSLSCINVDDLSTETLCEIIPDSVGSIKSIGYFFGENLDSAVLNKGKNLFDDSIVLSRYDNGTSVYEKTIAKVWGVSNTIGFLINVKSNTTYSISSSIVFFDFRVHFTSQKIENGFGDWDWSIGYVSGMSNGSSFTTPNNCKYIYLYFSTSLSEYDFSLFQLEEGTEATPYIPPKKDKIQLPELHGIAGVYSDLNYERIKREQKTTDGSGTLAVEKTANGTYVAVKVSDGIPTWGSVSDSTSITGLAANTEYQIFYPLKDPIPQNLPTKIPIYTGDNNIICEGAAIAITHTKESSSSYEILAFAEGFKATDNKSWYEYQPVNFKGKKRLETSRGHKITIDNLYLDDSWDQRFDRGETFTLEVKDDNEDESRTIITKYHGCQIDSLSRDEGDYIKRGIEITAQSKEVIEI